VQFFYVILNINRTLFQALAVMLQLDAGVHEQLLQQQQQQLTYAVQLAVCHVSPASIGCTTLRAMATFRASYLY